MFENKDNNNPEKSDLTPKAKDGMGEFNYKYDEFLPGVTDNFNLESLDKYSRRKFLAILAASAALTNAACSDYRDKGEIVPYNDRPPEILPGQANYYASTCNGCYQSCGILVKTREGRPIKLEGNPDHPINKGKICSTGQAGIMNLYDPERLKDPTQNGRKTNWEEIDSQIRMKLSEVSDSGKGIAVIGHKNNSPTSGKLFKDFKAKFPNSNYYSYEYYDSGAKKEAWEEFYGKTPFPLLKIDEADVIFAVDSDFLGTEGFTVENIRKYTSRRDLNNAGKFNRLYSAEGRMSLTGMNADYRFRVRPDRQFGLLMSLLSEAVKKSSLSYNFPSEFISLLSQFSLEEFAAQNSLDSANLNLLLNDLLLNKGKALVIAGDSLDKNVHLAANLLNEVLENTSLYDFQKSEPAEENLSSVSELKELVAAIKSGEIGVVIHYDSNPVFHFPADLGYKEALANVGTVISLTMSQNESSASAGYVLPINHDLESWGDFNPRNSVYSLMQPVIAPIFNTRQKEAVILNWLSQSENTYSEDIYHKYLMDNVKESVYSKLNPAADFKTFWYSVLHDGVIGLPSDDVPELLMNNNIFSKFSPGSLSGDFVVHLTPNYFIGDGRFANNGWLQEIPHPVSKVTWDNYASISPATAKELGCENNDVIKISVDNRVLEIPVMLQPGLPEGYINIELGYGRNVIGAVGQNTGFNGGSLFAAQSGFISFVYTGAEVIKTDKTYELISTQEHHALDDPFVKDFHRIRKIIKDGTVSEYQKDPEFLKHGEHEIFSITREHPYPGVKWAMSIDLNKCISCSVCVASCNVENNIPVVGKDQVAKGREMHWMRIDRYYSGTPEEPLPSNQPMLCQHCDNAPCENVCPVNATNHSPDGLNQMVYNRCVGTRYCSNNCPYKVRRFNFFNFRDHFKDSLYENDLTSLLNNPEVTVRSRGVMEKCTFCVHKIMEARSDAIKEGREVKGSDVVTACQQACPAEAIVFGDANDPDSKISEYRDHNLSYHVLEELNIKPNVTYLAKLRNTQTEDS